MFFACIHINYVFPASKLHCTKELISHTSNSVPTPSCLFLLSFQKQSRSTVYVCACIGVCSLDIPTQCLVFMKFGTYVPIIDNNNKASPDRYISTFPQTIRKWPSTRKVTPDCLTSTHFSFHYSCHTVILCYTGRVILGSVKLQTNKRAHLLIKSNNTY